jgi:thiol-disulfide isomerase/thioredoxin
MEYINLNNFLIIIFWLILLYIFFYYSDNTKTEKFANVPTCNNKIIVQPTQEISKVIIDDNDKIKVYNFNTTWCGYSKQFQPIWDDFVSTIKDEDNIDAYDLKCDNDNYNDLVNKYEIEGFPTVIIEKSNNFIKYNGPRTVEGLRNALNLSSNNKKKIYNFNTEWCGHSKQFQPTWNTFMNSIKEKDNVEAYDVKCDNPINDNLCNKYDVPGYPTIVIVDGNNVENYSGPRTIEGLRKKLNI